LLDAAARLASRLRLRASPRCLESVSTTNVRVTSTRRSTTFGVPFVCRGKPAGIRIGIFANDAFPLSVRRDAGPPRGHPASNGARLTAHDRLRTVRQQACALRSLGENRRSFLGQRAALSGRSSDTLVSLSPPRSAPSRRPVSSAHLRAPWRPSLARRVRDENSTDRYAIGPGNRNCSAPLAFFEIEPSSRVNASDVPTQGVPSVGEAQRCHLFRGLATESAARCWPNGGSRHTDSSRLEELRLDPDHASLSRALRSRVRFYDFCKQTLLRARLRTTRTSKPMNDGWDGCLISIESHLSIEVSRRCCARSGVEQTESRHSPP
jgi:hypothetical protein